MYEVYFQKFNEKVALTQQEEDFIKQYLTPKRLRKKQYLLQAGDVCRQVGFVEKGALRAYLADEKGDEHITAFAFEGWAISDLPSFIRQEPASLNIEALEDCELLLLSKAAHDELLQKLPKYESYLRILVTNAYISMQQRMTDMISLSIEDRYLAFTKMHQLLFQRVPQHMIASFMGLSPETLSRVRSRLSNKK